MDGFASKNGIVRSEVIKSIKNLEKEFIKLLGPEAKHKKGETVKQWLVRNVEKSRSIEKVEQKMAA